MLLFLSTCSTETPRGLGRETGPGNSGTEAELLQIEHIVPRNISLDDAFEEPKHTALVEDFLKSKVGSTEISSVIFRETRKNELPISLTLALAWAESRFDPMAVNRNETTVDRGLYQLNNRSFPELTEAEFFDPSVNADHGIAYLKYCLERGENEITALAMYNAGPTRVSERGAPRVTLTYIDKIFTYREALDRDFREKFQTNTLVSLSKGSEIIDRDGRSQ